MAETLGAVMEVLCHRKPRVGFRELGVKGSSVSFLNWKMLTSPYMGKNGALYIIIIFQYVFYGTVNNFFPCSRKAFETTS